MIRQPLLAAVAAAIALPITAAPASAADQRPCVSQVEYQGAKANLSRKETEDRWDVTGLGRVVLVPYLGRTVIYPRCGYASRSQAWYGAAYDHLGLWATAAWRDDGAHPHGHLRTAAAR